MSLPDIIAFKVHRLEHRAHNNFDFIFLAGIERGIDKETNVHVNVKVTEEIVCRT